MDTTMTYKEKVHKYLKQNRRYVSTSELNNPEIGGKDGTRRLRELRADGINIISRRNPETGMYEYKIKR